MHSVKVLLIIVFYSHMCSMFLLKHVNGLNFYDIVIKPYHCNKASSAYACVCACALIATCNMSVSASIGQGTVRVQHCRMV